MGIRGRRANNCFCAFCKTPRRVARRRHVGAWNIFLSLLAAAAVMHLTWQAFDPRALMFFSFFVAVAELFIQLRWRLSIVCKVCGFDPALYVRDTAAAAQKVRERLERRQHEPATWLAPRLDLPALPAREAPSGARLSRHA